MSYSLAMSLGLCGQDEDDDSDEPEAQLIWLLLREEARDESQSLRDDFKMQMKSLKEMQRRQQDMDLKLDALAKMQLAGASTFANHARAAS